MFQMGWFNGIQFFFDLLPSIVGKPSPRSALKRCTPQKGHSKKMNKMYPPAQQTYF